ncbi:hypothetical protein [Streptomyces swartbergensis]|uniref:hypothetical protein n=1 Tax=Streptomyces swartbergensis TaxID=487165 RepID=UPI0037F808FF
MSSGGGSAICVHRQEVAEGALHALGEATRQNEQDERERQGQQEVPHCSRSARCPSISPCDTVCWRFFWANRRSDVHPVDGDAGQDVGLALVAQQFPQGDFGFDSMSWGLAQVPRTVYMASREENAFRKELEAHAANICPTSHLPSPWLHQGDMITPADSK